MSQSMPLKTMAQRNDSWYVDSKLLVPAMALLSIGLIMVASSSFSYAEHRFDDQFYFVKRHFAYLLLSMGAIAGLLYLANSLVEIQSRMDTIIYSSAYCSACSRRWAKS